jgi:hypothetical protein
VVVATPEAFSVPVPKTDAFSWNVTVPVGEFEPLVFTVAVSVTGAPKAEGFVLEVTLVVVVTGIGWKLAETVQSAVIGPVV